MSINLDLRIALIKRFGTQVEAARQLGIREAKLSYIVRGHVGPSQAEFKSLEVALGKTLVRRLLKERGARQ
jgi:helix-turn-helix protein